MLRQKWTSDSFKIYIRFFNCVSCNNMNILKIWGKKKKKNDDEKVLLVLREVRLNLSLLLSSCKSAIRLHEKSQSLK